MKKLAFALCLLFIYQAAWTAPAPAQQNAFFAHVTVYVNNKTDG